jgi:hypothetical protein
VVKDFIAQNLCIFPAKMEHAESALMPSTKSWVRSCLDDMSCHSPEDHMVMLWLNCPVVGIISSEKYDFFLTCVCNFLADWSRNGVCVIIHPNRAAQLDKRTVTKTISNYIKILVK